MVKSFHNNRLVILQKFKYNFSEEAVVLLLQSSVYTAVTKASGIAQFIKFKNLFLMEGELSHWHV